MEALNQAIAWMEAHDKLAGWAQFAGATVAVALAIAIPSWQRYLQRLDSRRQAADLNLTLALGTFFVLEDTKNHLTGFQMRTNMPRRLARDDNVRDDLLRRIHALEMRDTDQQRIRSLFLGRGTIHQTNLEMASPFLQDTKYSEGELKLLADRITLLKNHILLACKNRDDSGYVKARIDLPFLGRIVFPLAWYIATRRRAKAK
ncbi:hypothetical protein [Collimonas pratensis]|uniref:hypothetical protein n=1 Tax=Collimonas pratensis TaxID=279113 RepID=UPI000782F56B|nr:hypothetical protein [Collimonas pratensis]